MSQSKEEQCNKLYRILLHRNAANMEAIKQFMNKISLNRRTKKLQNLLEHHKNASSFRLSQKNTSHSKYQTIQNAKTKQSETKIDSPCPQQQNKTDCIQQKQEPAIHNKRPHYKYSLPNQFKPVKKISPNKSRIQKSVQNISIFDQNSLNKEVVVRPAHRTWKTESQKAILNFRQIVFPTGKPASRMSNYSSLKKANDDERKSGGNKNLVTICDQILALKKMRETKTFLPHIKRGQQLKGQLNAMFMREKKQNLQMSGIRKTLKLQAVPIYNIDWNADT